MRTFVALFLTLAPSFATAHHFMDDALPQTFLQGLLSGIGHPLIGPDHAAFIIGAGFSLALVARGVGGIVALIGGSLLGVIERDHGVFVFADTNAMTRDRKPQHCYSVRFSAQELWGPAASARDSVYIDLWDDHLDPARG